MVQIVDGGKAIDEVVDNKTNPWKKEEFPVMLEKLKNSRAELEKVVQVMDQLQKETTSNAKIIKASKEDIHQWARDVIKIKNAIIADFTSNMPPEGRKEIDITEKYLSKIFQDYNLEIMKIFT